MGRFINSAEGAEYLRSIEDPIVQMLIERAYSNTFFEPRATFDGDFDLLFFYKIMVMFLRDREGLAKVMSGEINPLDEFDRYGMAKDTSCAEDEVPQKDSEAP